MNVNDLIEQGKELTTRGAYPAAAEKFSSALAAEPENRAALFELGKLHYILHQYDDAVGFLTALLRSGPDVTAVSLLGKAYTETGKSEAAIAVYEEAVKQGLADAETFRELGDIYKRQGIFARAEEIYGRSLEKDPGNAGVLFELVQLYNFEGKFDLTRKKMQEYGSTAASGDDFSRNRLLNEREIAEKKTVLDSKPRIMLVTLTNRCNLRCVMCGKGSTIWDISEKHKQEIIAALPYLELITWQGGEVFLYPGFADMLDAARRHRHLRQIIITNGLLIDEIWAQKLIEQNQLDLTISIDSIERERYEKLRPGSNYDTLLSNVKRLTALREKNASNMFLTLRFTVMKENYTEIEALIDFARQYQFNALILYPINEMGGQEEYKNIFHLNDPGIATVVQRAREKVREKAARYGLRLMDWLPHPPCGEEIPEKKDEVRLLPLKQPSCFRPWKQIAMQVSGSLYPECLCTEPLGTVFKNSFEEVWNNEKMQEYRRKMMSDDRAWCCEPCVGGDIPPGHLKFVCG